MPVIHDINPRIVEGLYCEALVLADELRAQIDCSDVTAGSGVRGRKARQDHAELRVAISCESLRATTRLMHCIAWLLNHRAFYAGEISQIQLRRHGRLIDGFPAGDTFSLASFPRRLAALIADSEDLYARILRLDRNWRSTSQHVAKLRNAPATGHDDEAPAVHQLQSRLGQSL